MKTPLLVVATGVLGIAIGFIAGRGGDLARGDGGDAAGVAARHREPPDRPGPSAGGPRGDSLTESTLAALLKGRSAADMTAAEAYELFGPFLKMRQTGGAMEKAKANYQLHLLASKLPLPVLEELITLGKQDGVLDFDAGIFFRAMAERDWDRAIDLARKNGSQIFWASDAIADMAMTDPDRALDLYEKTSLETTWPDGNSVAATTLAKSFAKRGNAEFYKFVDGMPASMRSSTVMFSARNIPKENIPAFLEELKRRAETDPIYQSALHSVMMSQIADPKTTREWIDSNPDGGIRAYVTARDASKQFSQGKTAEAEEKMRTAMSQAPEGGKEFVKMRVIHAMRNQPEQVEWLAGLLPADQQFAPADLTSVEYSSTDNPGNVVDVARALRKEEDRATYLEAQFAKLEEKKLTAREFRVLSQRLDALRLTGESATRAETALENARKQGADSKTAN